jgi:predicted enzyme related to lactoylglutathione lyase
MGVVGMGGLFFRAKDPDALGAWYREHLNVGSGCVAEGAGEPDEWAWMIRGGPMIFSPFKETTDYFPADKAFMINLRVEGLDALIARLRTSGVEVETRDDWTATEAGSFARIHDPEGNAIELWEPPAEE